MPDSAQESRASVPGFGRRSCDSFVWFDRDSSSWKTWQLCLIGGWEEFSEIWPRAGLMRNGECSARPISHYPIKEIGYSLWPTPSASDGLRAKFSLPQLQKTFARLASEWLTGPAQGNLSEHFAAECDSCLMPEFSEWVMGFPVGWTDLGDAETP